MLSIAVIGLYSEDFVNGIFSDIKDLKNKVKLTAISDQDDSLLLKYQKAWHIKKLYTDPDDLIASEIPDILCISMKTDKLLDIILFAISKKIKGIILDRPIYITLEISRKIAELCRLNNINLIINHKKRWDPLYRNVKEIINTQTLGELITISADINNNSAKKGDPQKILNKYGGGDLLYEGLDLIDLVRYFSGETKSINSTLKRTSLDYSTETSSNSILQMHSGITAYLKTNNISDYDNFELDLFFSRGRIIVGKDIKKFYIAGTGKDNSSGRELIESDFVKLETKNNYNSNIIEEMEYSLNKNILPESSGLSAIKNVEVAFGIYYSAYLSGNTVTLPLKIGGNPLLKMFQSNML